MPTPRIDYAALSNALGFYQVIGFTYVEVPWLASDAAIAATLPEGCDYMQIGVKPSAAPRDASGYLQRYYGIENALVGSAEQGFLELGLAPGRYVGVTPCFRCEDRCDLFTQDTFMKVELFDNCPDATVKDILEDANRFFSLHAQTIVVETPDGFDITIGGVEIGSYGERTHPDFGRWVYGTGLALPRFSVAKALREVL